MNLLAIYRSYIIIAVNSEIKIYFLSNAALKKSLSYHLTAINSIRIGSIGDDDYLISVDDYGRVVCFNLTTNQPKIYENGSSTWGSAVHHSGLIAVSSNSWQITLMDINSDFRKCLRGHGKLIIKSRS